MEQEKHATFSKEEYRKNQYGRAAELRRGYRDSPHCPLDIRRLKLIDGTAVCKETSADCGCCDGLVQDK